jgi:hypothetical protein
MLLWSSVVLFSVLHTTNAFRALYLASNVGYSHIEYTGRLADALVDAGHEVVSYCVNIRNLSHFLGLCY